jgi:hypothetical protein
VVVEPSFVHVVVSHFVVHDVSHEVLHSALHFSMKALTHSTGLLVSVKYHKQVSGSYQVLFPDIGH